MKPIINTYKCPIEECGRNLGENYQEAYRHVNQPVETSLPKGFVFLTSAVSDLKKEFFPVYQMVVDRKLKNDHRYTYNTHILFRAEGYPIHTMRRALKLTDFLENFKEGLIALLGSRDLEEFLKAHEERVRSYYDFSPIISSPEIDLLLKQARETK